MAHGIEKHRERTRKIKACKFGGTCKNAYTALFMDRAHRDHDGGDGRVRNIIRPKKKTTTTTKERFSENRHSLNTKITMTHPPRLFCNFVLACSTHGKFNTHSHKIYLTRLKFFSFFTSFFGNSQQQKHVLNATTSSQSYRKCENNAIKC